MPNCTAIMLCFYSKDKMSCPIPPSPKSTKPAKDSLEIQWKGTFQRWPRGLQR